MKRKAMLNYRKLSRTQLICENLKSLSFKNSVMLLSAIAMIFYCFAIGFDFKSYSAFGKTGTGDFSVAQQAISLATTITNMMMLVYFVVVAVISLYQKVLKSSQDPKRESYLNSVTNATAIFVNAVFCTITLFYWKGWLNIASLQSFLDSIVPSLATQEQKNIIVILLAFALLAPIYFFVYHILAIFDEHTTVTKIVNDDYDFGNSYNFCSGISTDVVSIADRYTTCYHEVGHVIAYHLLGQIPDYFNVVVRKFKDGKDLGYVQSFRYNQQTMSVDFNLWLQIMLLSGQQAERLLSQEVGVDLMANGVSADYERFVKLSYLYLRNKGRTMHVDSDVSESLSNASDLILFRVFIKHFRYVSKLSFELLSHNKELMREMADDLFNQGSLNHDEVIYYLKQVKVPYEVKRLYPYPLGQFDTFKNEWTAQAVIDGETLDFNVNQVKENNE